MMDFNKIAAGTAIAGSLELAALGIGTGVANAAPSPVGSGIQWAQSPGWGHGAQAGTAAVAAGTADTAVTAAAGPTATTVARLRIRRLGRRL
jgi:hypothetical protein